MSGGQAATDAGGRVARWLEQENGTGTLQQVLQVVAKPLEELNEILVELERDDRAAAAEECADLVITVRTAQVTLGGPSRPVAGLVTKAFEDVPECWGNLVRAVTELGAMTILWTGQNPRKRSSLLPVADVADHLDLVVVATCRLIDALGHDVDEVLRAGAEKVNARLDEMDVPG